MSASDEYGGLFFNENGPTSPDASEIRGKLAEIIKGIWGQDIDISAKTPQGQLLDSWTATVFDKNNKLVFLSNMWNPETNMGKWQEDVGKIYFANKHLAYPTQVYCTCTGLPGTVIPVGAMAQSKSGDIFLLSHEIVIPASGIYENALFYCEKTGPIYCPKDSCNRIYQRINGWDTVTNPEAGILGANEESRLAFERRRYASVAKNAHGNVSAVWGAIANLDGVLSVNIAENITNVEMMLKGVLVNGHSMFISVWGGDNMEIAKTIFERKDAGCGLDGNTQVVVLTPTRDNDTTQETVITFHRPSQTRAYVQVNAKIYPDITPSNIEHLIKQQVYNDWYGLLDANRVEIGEEVFASRFYCPLNQLPNYKLTSVFVGRDSATGEPFEWVDSFSSTIDEIPVLTLDDIEVNLTED